MTREAIRGCLLGQAVGDAMGLPTEGLSRRRGPRLYPRLDRMQFFFGLGTGSDDTDHACMTAAALCDGGDFSRRLAWRLRWWLLGGPAGIGKATLRACVKLWLGFPPSRSGVFSAGNGPAMRAAILGVAAKSDEELRRLVRESTRLTHTDPKAEYGALAVALAARHPDGFADRLDRELPHDPAADELRGLVRRMTEGLADGLSVVAFAGRLGLPRGVGGYIYHTVPVALFAYFRHADDYRAAIPAVIRCGGDTDTVAAIVGGLIGGRVGKAGIPAEWLAAFRDWPWSVGRIERLADCLADSRPFRSSLLVRLVGPYARLLRNVLFLLVVLGHVVRRLLPPY